MAGEAVFAPAWSTLLSTRREIIVKYFVPFATMVCPTLIPSWPFLLFYLTLRPATPCSSHAPLIFVVGSVRFG